MALLYGRVGRLTVENGGFWPGQFSTGLMAEADWKGAKWVGGGMGQYRKEFAAKVRETPSWPLVQPYSLPIAY
jgi:hypothetical protein